MVLFSFVKTVIITFGLFKSFVFNKDSFSSLLNYVLAIFFGYCIFKSLAIFNLISLCHIIDYQLTNP